MPSTASRFSDPDQLYMGARDAGQVKQVGWVAGQDVIAVLGEAYHGRVNDVRGAGAREQQAGAAALNGIALRKLNGNGIAQFEFTIMLSCTTVLYLT